MKFKFIETSETSTEKTIAWFHAIGIYWITAENIHNQFIEIEFLNTPAILKIASRIARHPLSVCNISNFGVSFYLIVPMFGEPEEFSFESDSADGVLFVPMNNIKSISDIGKLLRNSEKNEVQKLV